MNLLIYICVTMTTATVDGALIQVPLLSWSLAVGIIGKKNKVVPFPISLDFLKLRILVRPKDKRKGAENSFMLGLLLCSWCEFGGKC